MDALCLRKTTAPDPELWDIYTILDLSANPGGVKKQAISIHSNAFVVPLADYAPQPSVFSGNLLEFQLGLRIGLRWLPPIRPAENLGGVATVAVLLGDTPDFLQESC